MKKFQLMFSTIALPIDYIMLVVAGLLAYQIRFYSFIKVSLPVRFDLPLSDYIPTLFIVAFVWLALFALSGLYNLQSHYKFSQEIGKVFLGCTSGLALIVLLFFFNPNLFNSRFIVLVGWIFSFLFVTTGRLILRITRSILYRHNIGVNRLLLVGSDNASLALANFFINKPELGYKLINRVDPQKLDFENVGEIDEILVGESSLSHEDNIKILDFCMTHHLGFKYVADMFEAQSHNVVSHTLAGMPIIEIKRTALDGWGRVLKRLFDIIVSFLLFLILGPLLILLALLIVLGSGWPMIVGLNRVGEAGKIFKMFKFRSMINGADNLKNQLMQFNERADGPLFKMTNDPRITKIGYFLRRTSFDELPQLWNVFKGDMSLVGPRPHEPSEVAKYEAQHRKLLNIKPGITGLSQVSGRSGLTFDEEAKLDTFYLENWSIVQDLIILIKTVIVVMQRRSAV